MRALEALLDLHDLTAAIHTGLQIDMVRTVQFTCGLVLDIGVALEGVVRAAHVALRARDFGLWNGHRSSLSSRLGFPEPEVLVAIGSALTNQSGCVGETPVPVNPEQPYGGPDVRSALFSRLLEITVINLVINFLFT